MRRILMIALASAAVGLAATSASAATLQICTSGASCVSGTTNVNLGAFNSPGSATVTGNVGVGGPEVDFTSANGLLETNTGAATIFTASGGLLSQLTFTLMSGGFTSAEFNLENGSIKAMDVTLTVANCLVNCTKVISITNANGSNIFDIIGDPGEVFTTASFTTTSPNGFADFKQLRLVLADSVSAVPEPGTWGLMLLGFAGVGMALRRSRKRGGALMQVA
jgi:hypothetical protein